MCRGHTAVMGGEGGRGGEMGREMKSRREGDDEKKLGKIHVV